MASRALASKAKRRHVHHCNSLRFVGRIRGRTVTSCSGCAVVAFHGIHNLDGLPRTGQPLISTGWVDDMKYGK